MSRVLQSAFCLAIFMSGFAFADDASLRAIDAEHRANQRKKQADVMRRLSTPVDVRFIDTPLSDAMQFLGDAHRITFAIDKRDLADIGISTEDTFTLVRQATPLRNVLDDILRNEILDLDWYVVGDVVHITSVDETEHVAEVRIYDVSEFLPRSKVPFTNSYIGTTIGGYTGGAVCAAPNSDGGEGFFLVDSIDVRRGSSVDDIAESPAIVDRRSENVPSIETKPAEKSATGAESQNTTRRAPSSGARSATDFYDFMPFIENIEQAVAPDTWAMAGGAATIGPMVVNGKPILVIRASRRSHEGVADLFEMLRLVSQ